MLPDTASKTCQEMTSHGAYERLKMCIPHQEGLTSSYDRQGPGSLYNKS